MVCCSEFPVVTQLVWKGGLRKSNVSSGKPDYCSRSTREMPRGMKDMPRSMRKMQRRVKDARIMADGCSVLHPYYYHNHDMWPQIYGKVYRATDGQGSLVECATNMPWFTLRMMHGLCNTFFTCQIMVNILKHFKTVGALQSTCRTLQDDAECLYDSCRLPQITTGIFPTFISIDNRDHKLAQCEWGFTGHSVKSVFWNIGTSQLAVISRAFTSESHH